jgi:hypothetical protein
VLSLNTNKVVTSGEVRLAVRDSADPDDWSYETLDGPKFGSAVAGFATALSIGDKNVRAAWLVARGFPLNAPNMLTITDLKESRLVSTLTAPEFGNFSRPLQLNGPRALLACGKRLCSTDFTNLKLVNAEVADAFTGGPITFSKQTFWTLISNRTLLLIKL